MKLIDVDKLVNDIAEHITVKAVSRVLAIIQGQPTVKAIPIERIEKFMNRFRCDMVISDEYALLHYMLTEWEKENEGK